MLRACVQDDIYGSILSEPRTSGFVRRANAADESYDSESRYEEDEPTGFGGATDSHSAGTSHVLGAHHQKAGYSLGAPAGSHSHSSSGSNVHHHGNNRPQASLYISNLTWWTTEDDLKAFFGAAGLRVKELQFVDNRSNGKSKGIAIVEFVDVAAGTAAREAIEGKEINGRVCEVSYAKSAPLKPYVRAAQFSKHAGHHATHHGRDSSSRGGFRPSYSHGRGGHSNQSSRFAADSETHSHVQQYATQTQRGGYDSTRSSRPQSAGYDRHARQDDNAPQRYSHRGEGAHSPGYRRESRSRSPERRDYRAKPPAHYAHEATRSAGHYVHEASRPLTHEASHPPGHYGHDGVQASVHYAHEASRPPPMHYSYDGVRAQAPHSAQYSYDRSRAPAQYSHDAARAPAPYQYSDARAPMPYSYGTEDARPPGRYAGQSDSRHPGQYSQDGSRPRPRDDRHAAPERPHY